MRDDFPKSVKEQLYKQVGGVCSNPNCSKHTLASTSDGKKDVSIGEAAHIKAASPGGPRYDPTQSPEERKSIENGIWLCCNCAKLIDADTNKFTVEVLLQWKSQAMERQRKNLGASSNHPFVRHEQTYLTKADNPGVLFCSVCYDYDGKVVQMKTNSGFYECVKCHNNGIYDSDLADELAHKISRRRGRRVISEGIKI